MNDTDSRQLIEAIRLWTGWGQGSMPNRDDKRLVDHFGEEVAANLLPRIISLEKEFYSSDACRVADLQEMGKLASEQFKRKHQAIVDEIVRAFEWCYTFDWK